MNFILPAGVRKAAFQDPAVRATLRWEAVDKPRPGAFHKRWEFVYIVKPALDKNAPFDM
jgi:hypothetical protein